MDAPRRAALYARVSSDPQARDDRWSLPAQRADFAAHCAERGYEPVAEYQDVMSGARVSRRGYQRMLADARTGLFDTIVVTFLDRFGRDERETVRRVLELEELGVSVDAVHEDIEEFIRLMLTAWKAGEERRRIGERIRIAHRLSASHGTPIGRTPVGYRKRADLAEDGRRRNLRLEVDPVSAPLVRDIFRWYLDEALSMRAIARRLNEQGRLSPGGKPWHVNRVRRVLTNRTYAGDVRWGDVVARDAHEPIVPRERWEAAQARIRRRAELPAGRTRTSGNLLAGIIFCGHCGGRMNAWHPAGQPRRYVCRAYRQVRGCETLNPHPADDVEARVLAYLDGVAAGGPSIPPPDGEAEAAARAAEELARVDARMEQLAERRRRNLRAWHEEVLGDRDLAEANRLVAEEEVALLAERDQWATELDRLAAAAERRATIPDQARRLRSLVADGNTPAAKALLQDLGIRVVLFKGDPQPVVYL